MLISLVRVIISHVDVHQIITLYTYYILYIYIVNYFSMKLWEKFFKNLKFFFSYDMGPQIYLTPL